LTFATGEVCERRWNGYDDVGWTLCSSGTPPVRYDWRT